LTRIKLRDVIMDLQKTLKELDKQRSREASGNIVEVARQIADESEGDLIVRQVEGATGKTLRDALDVIRKKKPHAAVLLAAVEEDKVSLAASVPESWIKRGLKAGDWIREIAKIVGGSGGGRPDMAQAGGKDTAKVGEALAEAR